MSVYWLILAVLMGIIEAVTVQLVSIWFAIGAVAGCITSLFCDNVWIQISVFVVVTLVALVCTRPLAKKFNAFSRTHTNSDKYIGKSAVVLSEINNAFATGQVKVGTSVWSAKSADNTVIPVGATVTVKAIEGVKLVVEYTK